MDPKCNSPEQKLVIEMLRLINRYEGEKSKLAAKPAVPRDPLRVNFRFSPSQKETQRNHQRINFEGEVNLNKDDAFIVGHCLNISASGIFVSCQPEDFVQVNDLVHLIIKLQDDLEIFRAPARVARQDRFGYALQFMTLA